MTARKVQRLGNNSTAAKVKTMQVALTTDIPVPKGVRFQSEEDIVLWNQVVSTRAEADWREIDLVLAAKMVGIERDIRRYQAQLEREGPVVFTQKGTPVPNPHFTIINTLQTQLLNIIRTLGLTRTGTDPRSMNAAGKRGQQAAKTAQGLNSGLFALPSR